ncbi:MAG: hypothetical protein LKJ25_00845 [Clostridia bacterium]|nr:hypothetical protein [Clostridia bacterium]
MSDSLNDSSNDVLRSKYWSMYNRLKYESFYFWFYRDRAQTIEFWLQLILFLASSSGVAGWFIWDKIPFVWSSIIFISQAIQACKHLLPYQSQIEKINYLMPNLDKLINRIDHDWEETEYMEDKQLTELIYNYENEFLSLKNEFIGFTPFKHNKKCKLKAEEELKKYFSYRFELSSDEGGENNGQT